MLSAVAARKARLEGKNVPTEVALAPCPPPSLVLEKVAAPKPPSKRKPSDPSIKPPRKKKRPQPKRVIDNQTRYFAQDELITAAENSDTSQNDMSVDEDRFELHVPLAVQPSPPASRGDDKKHPRAWSPSAPLVDSSDDEDNAAGDPAENSYVPAAPPLPTARSAPETPSLLSTFQPILGQNVFHVTPEDLASHLTPQSKQKGTVFVLHLGDTVAFLGAYSLTILHGTISVAGVTLTPSHTPHHVFAPRSSPLPVIQCISSNERVQDGAINLPPFLGTAAVQGSAILLLQELRTGVEGLGHVCRTFEDAFTPSRWQSSTMSFDTALEGVHLLTQQTHDISPFSMPASWEAALSAVEKNTSERHESGFSRQVYLVKGPRNAGKSTFSRCLLNRLSTRYRRVAFLECDLGQSEFTPGGMVALNIADKPLFGPPFTHPSIPHSAHYIGASSPRSSPSHYLDGIQALIQSYDLDVQHAALVEPEEHEEGDDRIADVIPLVVNTMGWTKGLGADLSRKIEEYIEPSDVFEFETQVQDEGWALSAGGPSQTPFPALDAVRRHVLEPIRTSTLSSRYTPADHRTLAILSYFHAQFPSGARIPPLCPAIAISWNTALPLCAQPPYEVDWNITFDKVFLTGAGTEDVVPSEIRRVMNLAIVGLVSCEPDTLDGDSDGTASEGVGALPYTQDAPPPSPFSSKCYGLALIRGLSLAPASSLLHILTPVPPHLFSTCRVLVKGELELPVWGMLDFRSADGDVAGVERGKVPYLRWGKGEGAGGERRRFRRNLMRRGQM
ncbi:hypothetical protein B0H21DRAFT_125216 [Amylocystis lapponica]|nr:hypothetical protein B0H21DRAFT_125216 [Amylocystis lapponica]